MDSEQPLTRDTSAEAERLQIERWRSMTPAEKWHAFTELMELTQALAEAGVRRRHPAADAREVFLRVAALRLDRGTMIRVYGWDPEEHG
jgi:hypothetical protein